MGGIGITTGVWIPVVSPPGAEWPRWRWLWVSIQDAKAEQLLVDTFNAVSRLNLGMVPHATHWHIKGGVEGLPLDIQVFRGGSTRPLPQPDPGRGTPPSPSGNGGGVDPQGLVCFSLPKD